MLAPKSHEYYMKKALALAQGAYDAGEVPIGAIIVSKDQIIAKGFNQVEQLNDATAHAEMIAITAAADYLNSKYLPNCTLYVTVEPCVMCGGASKWAQIPNIVFGAYDKKMGLFSNTKNILPSKTVVIGGVLESDCVAIMQQFFKERRDA